MIILPNTSKWNGHLICVCIQNMLIKFRYTKNACRKNVYLIIRNSISNENDYQVWKLIFDKEFL